MAHAARREFDDESSLRCFGPERSANERRDTRSKQFDRVHHLCVWQGGDTHLERKTGDVFAQLFASGSV